MPVSIVHPRCDMLAAAVRPDSLPRNQWVERRESTRDNHPPVSDLVTCKIQAKYTIAGLNNVYSVWHASIIWGTDSSLLLGGQQELEGALPDLG